MPDEEDRDEPTFGLLPLSCACETTEKTAHPFEEMDNVAEMKVMFEDECGNIYMSECLPHTSGSTLGLRRGVEEGAGNAPSFIIEDQETGITVGKSVHTYDDKDDRPRMNWIKYPECPPLKDTKTFHPITSGMRARITGGGTKETTWSEWPDHS